MAREKKNPLAHMERHSNSTDTFPDSLWMGPFRGNYAAPKVQSESELPDWMSRAAKQDVMATAAKDRENNARWWVKLWQEHPQPHSPELLFVATAMAATLGWPSVVQNLIDRGAPLVMERPAAGWQWMDNNKMKLPKDRYSILDVCAWAMSGFTAIVPLHGTQVASLDVLVENGARVEDTHPKTSAQMMRHEHLAKWFIANGLKADRVVGPDQIVFDELFAQWPKISPNVHGRIVSAFIDHGMPVRFTPDGPSLPQRLTNTVAGLSQMHRLAVHPDRVAICAAFHEAMPQIEKRLKLRNKQDQENFRGVFEVVMLDLDTPKAQAMRARARL